MTLARITFAAVVLSVCGAFATPAKAASYNHIDNLALQLQNQASTLFWEFRNHYSHAAHYGHLSSDASAMYRLAAHIHTVAHVDGNLDHIASDLNELDRLFHHVEGLVEHLEHDAYHGQGHVHGRTAHLQRLLAQIENILHHLRSDVDEMRLPPVLDNFGHGPGYGGGYGPGYGGGYGAGYGGGRVVWQNGGVSVGPGGLRISLGH